MMKHRSTGTSEKAVTLKAAADEHQRFVRPGSEGLLVRDPLTKAPLSAAGAMKPWVGPEGRYWRRRLACGDVVLGEAASAPAVNEIVEKKEKMSDRYGEAD